MHFSTRFVWRLCVPTGLTMDSDPPIWEPDMPAHFFVNAGPALHLCSSSFPGPPAVEGPSAERTASLAVERIGPVPQTWNGDRPTRSGTNSTFCAVVRSVCGAFLSGWGVGTLTGSTAGQPVRTARHLAPRSTTTRKPQLHGHGGGWIAPPTSHPLRLVPSTIGWACRPARRTCDPWVRYRIAAYRYTLYHTDDIMRKATRFPSRPRIEAPGFAPAQPEPLDAPLLPFARRHTAVSLYILWFRLPAPASSPELTKLEEQLEKPPPPLFGVRRGPFCHAPLRS